MASAFDHNNPKRLREVLLRHSKPAWPYPTLEHALALVAFLERLNQRKRSSEVSKRLAILQNRVKPTWSAVAPMQWEHFRAACQEALRQLSNGADFRPFRTTLTLIATFGVEEYVGHSNTFSKGGTIEVRLYSVSRRSSDAAFVLQSDPQSGSCFLTLEQEARRLQSRYASAGHRSGMRPEASFWFSQRPGHYEVGITAGRLRLLSRTAQDVLLEHVKYIANLDPLPAIDKLPSFDQLLVNAELGASYIRIKEAVLACGLPQEVKATYEQKFDFPALTTLPLELIAEITSDLEDAARHAHKHTLGHLFGTAAVAIYTSRVEAIVRCLRKTFITPAAIEKWKEDYLLPLKGWSGVGWSPSEMATEWAELQRVENDLLVGVFLSIDKLPKHALAYRLEGVRRPDLFLIVKPALTDDSSVSQGPFSLAHGYARISHRMARRIGTSKEAWEAERTTRGF
ncbi:hypothetical protein AAT19DRAFT_11423 [Rhodotorula toruloides]|uniref:Uncharacterized protein n=1 Tax=Rhodotorula toruloides TaxID=5286 RepID=A0A2S9ZWQ5_RHOTO|nr:hypothetical protein AAT19DRAFT_11423 [Rhodotorula toruloides]